MGMSVVGLVLLMLAIEGRVDVPGGRFVMGTRAEDVDALKARYRVSFPGAFENETPAREVVVGPFAMDAHEVTNAEYARFVAERGEWRRESVPEGFDARPDHPVVFVTWHAAEAYCEWAGGRLPTEAEWELAARAGTDAEFPWGEELPTPERANYHASGHGTTTPVGSYPPNPLGFYDLAGNVWEWLLDEWESPGEERRSVRGASYGGSVVNLRTRWRDSHVVSNAVEFVGFRCAYPSRGGQGLR